MSTRQPTRISELFASKWLSGADLEKPVVVTITEAGLQTVRQMDGSSEEKLVISFQNASKRLIVNKTQAVALALHLGDEWDKWIGARVKLGPATSPNGKLTIAVLDATPMSDRVPKETPTPPPATLPPPPQPQPDPADPDPELWKQQ